jgi:hypothetical protein
MGTPREPTPPSVQHPHDIQDFTPKSRKGTSLSQHRSDTDGNRAINPNELKAWADDFRKHYAVSELVVADFLEKYLPSDVPYVADHSSVSGVFRGVPLDQGEHAMYDPLVSILYAVPVRILTLLAKGALSQPTYTVFPCESKAYVRQHRHGDVSGAQRLRSCHQT